MIARFDHRPMLTALLALSTTLLFVVVVTLSTLLITLPQAAPSPSGSVGANPPTPKVMDAGDAGWYGEVYGTIQPKAAQNGGSGGGNPAAHAMSGTFNNMSPIERQHAFSAAKSGHFDYYRAPAQIGNVGGGENYVHFPGSGDHSVNCVRDRPL
jgi:hypothetical protein